MKSIYSFGVLQGNIYNTQDTVRFIINSIFYFVSHPSLNM